MDVICLLDAKSNILVTKNRNKYDQFIEEG